MAGHAIFSPLPPARPNRQGLAPASGGGLHPPPHQDSPVCSMLLVAACFVVLTYSHLLYGQMWGEVQDVLRKSPTYVTPDSTTFTVWLFIYVLEAAFVVIQFFPSARGDELLRLPSPMCAYLPIRIVIALLFLANATWMPLFAAELFGWSLVVCLVYLWLSLGAYTSLTIATSPLCCVRGGAPFSCHRLVYAAPAAANLSWLFVVSASNFMMWVGGTGRRDDYGVAGNPGSAILIVVGVAILASLLAVLYCDMVWAMVTGFALTGICCMQTVPDDSCFPVKGLNPSVAVISGVSVVLVVVSAAAGLAVAVVNWRSQRQHSSAVQMLGALE